MKVQPLESGEDVARYSRYSVVTGEKVLDAVRRRRETRPHDCDDIIVVLESWAHGDGYDIADAPILHAAEITDYSQKAYKIRGAVELDFEAIRTQSLSELQDGWLTDVVSTYEQEADGDYERTPGTGFLPKSAVAFVGCYEP